MLFTTLDYAVFLTVVFSLYWLIRHRVAQNLLLVLGSYVFYGWIHPWFCILIASSTVVDYFCGLAIERDPDRKKRYLWISIVFNLTLLGFFKYFHFFVDSFRTAFAPLGWTFDWVTLQVILPVGISFYTFQTLSYTIDIYRGHMRARRSFLDFAVFVSFFPQLVAGPIERARRFLPQIEVARRWSWDRFLQAWPLLVSGFFKKMLFADNIGRHVDRVFMLEDPSLLMLAAGAIAFAIEVYADFSAYSDIARGSARLIGFELMVNFRTPYLSLTLVDFWRRWHISLSTWIRDYIYIPLGGSRTRTELGFVCTLCAAMGLSGLWHGAAWSFVVWGIYHGLALFAYRKLGLDRDWRPAHVLSRVSAWAATFAVVTFGLAVFRSPSLAWFVDAVFTPRLGLGGDELAQMAPMLIGTPAIVAAGWIGWHVLGKGEAARWCTRLALVGALAVLGFGLTRLPVSDELYAAVTLLGFLLMFAAPWMILWGLTLAFPRATQLHHAWRWVMVAIMVLYAQEGSRAFVYFQF